MDKNIVLFSDVGKDDVALAGGKGANLGEMLKAGLPVPNGFIVTAKAYFTFLNRTSLKQKIKQQLKNLNIDDTKKLQAASERIKTAILAANIPGKINTQIKEAYIKLSLNRDVLVAVRSSATAEDLPEASFAGQQATFLNVKGENNVVRAVQKCWASLFEARAIFYRENRGFDHFKVGIAVPVQIMVDSEVSGIMFTVEPLTNDRGKVAIEAGFGLGQPFVSGEITPDQYLVDKKDGRILKKNIVKQTWQLVANKKIPVSLAYQKKQKLKDSLIKELATLGVRLEKHYKTPQDIEWAYSRRKLFIVQTRPVTTLKIQEEEKDKKVEFELTHEHKKLLEGIAASPGIASGPVKIIHSAKEINKISKGDVLVTEMTNPDFVPTMQKAVAIVTDKGGKTSHAAIVSRELGIPCIVGTKNATSMLSNGEVVTVDGHKGVVYEGEVETISDLESANVHTFHFKTATKIYVNLAEPHLADEIAQKNVDGVGLLRAEFIIADIGVHPKEMIARGKSREFIEKLADGLQTFCAAFKPRIVIYRATDFKTSEYRSLKGGEKYEPQEENPMLGFRGCFRYIEDADVFRLEIKALKKVRNKLGFKNLHLMIPFVHTVEELIKVKRILTHESLRRGPDFKLWMMVEIPSNVILLEEFIKVGIDGVSIGSNDLTMTTLGVDRDNPLVSEVYDEQNPAVLWAIERTIKIARKYGITSSICGQAPSNFPELTKKLVSWGITSVSINPDVIDKTRKIIYEAERDFVKNRTKTKKTQTF